MIDSAALRARLANVRDRIACAAGRAGRDPASVRLVAVSKTFSADHVRMAADVGQLDFGENKVQEALDKMQATADLRLRWHLIGHLQSNKARKTTGFHMVHSIDSIELLGKLDQAAAATGTHPEVLIQVDLAQEPTKFGALPDDVPAIVRVASQARAVRLRGLMTLPPAFDDPDDARPYFARLRTLRDSLTADAVDSALLGGLSMGMSHDFEIAIEEGATVVRVGSAIFGKRNYQGSRL